MSYFTYCGCINTDTLERQIEVVELQYVCEDLCFFLKTEVLLTLTRCALPDMEIMKMIILIVK